VRRDTVARDEEVLVIAVVWQFDVREGKEDEFERFYGADGAWTAISRRSRSFLGSSFLKDLAQPERYVVVEYWSEMLVYERHHADFADEVVELEQQRDALVSLMRPLGLFNALNVPDRSGPTWSQRTGRD
jgi:heme-degrading monooxygenase HmoA